MANINKINVNGTDYNIIDTTSGYLLPADLTSDAVSYEGDTGMVTETATNVLEAIDDLDLAIRQISVPSAGTTAEAVGTSASGGSATTWSKSDHVHSISDTTITSALGYTPYNSTNPSGYITASMNTTALWTNSSPSSGFPVDSTKTTQKVEVSLSSYNYVIIDFLFSGSGTAHFFQVFLIPTTGYVLAPHFRNYLREITTATDGVTFGVGKYFANYGTNTQTDTRTNLVPYAIYGVK